MGNGFRLGRAGLAVLCLTSVVIGVSGTAASAAGSKPPIVIGFITDETGGASSSYIDAQDGAMARIDAQNAAGGVDGRQLQLVVEDDQSTASGSVLGVDPSHRPVLGVDVRR